MPAGLRKAMNFVPGTDWSERGAGTNAPGTALALDGEVQIHGSEHYARVVQPWSCTAVPVHSRQDGALIGCIDLTGGDSVASAQTLALVRATVVAMGNHLALVQLAGQITDATPSSARLNVLGPGRPRWLVVDEYGHPRTIALTGRHADILVLLSRHPPSSRLLVERPLRPCSRIADSACRPEKQKRPSSLEP